MKLRFKKSKEVIVGQWLSRNRNLIGVANSALAADMEITECNRTLFSFKWNGVKGCIICKQRVLPSSLSIIK